MAQLNRGNPAFAAFAPQDGSAYWTLGMLVVVKVWGHDTAGRLSVCEFLCPPGYATPLHVHHREDESFWVIEGRIRYRCGEREFLADPGAYIYLPLGSPHGFRVIGQGNGRLLHIAVPAGMEEAHAEAGVATADLTVPPQTPLDMLRIVEVFRRYGVEVIGPPIE